MKAIVLILLTVILAGCAVKSQPAPVRIELQGHEVLYKGGL